MKNVIFEIKIQKSLKNRVFRKKFSSTKFTTIFGPPPGDPSPSRRPVEPLAGDPCQICISPIEILDAVLETVLKI